MRILFITHYFYPQIGGIEVNSEILAGEFHKYGHDVRLVTWSEDPYKKVFPYEVIRKPGKMKLIAEHKWAEVVFENNPSLRLAWPAFFLGKPSVVALRTWVRRNDGSMGWQDRLKTLWLARAKQVIAVSKAIRDECWPAASVIGNPYRNEVFKSLSDDDRPGDFMFLGRLVSDKGADLALKAFNEIVKFQGAGVSTKRQFNFTIVGDGPERKKLEALVDKFGINTSVHFTGALRGDALVEALNSHKYLIVPSVWKEPFGNVALEGLGCGCLPIVANGGGLPDAIGNAGMVFERGNLDALVNTLKNLLQDPRLEASLRSNASEHLKNHDPGVVASKYLKVINQALIES
ncbi:glycosyltransferase family 4 protein [Pedobacter psychroterrae]|uniref:Glycosyltransferase family 1 protein n=1 Tax=Pedobacter psychroterrae TaxID=2530453 RepID=A0A4V6N629_9SPHI|nr:glycosyltransferase family 4 protein [Pedobacter psychroterrae]TCD02677.1 glycosyltransferase family 1 protein [Pedobacter psychroterrae]